jgi:copper chaperone CopZ
MKKQVMLLVATMLISTLSVLAKGSGSFLVLGNCGMCKSRIEKAAKDAGASKAEWDNDTRMLTVEFKEKKTSLEKIQQQVAAVGHDTDKFKATDDVYDKLPGCCKYDRSGKPSEHKH